MTIFQKIGTILLAPIIALMGLFAPVQETPPVQEQKLRATFDDASSPVAFFETSLQASITGSSTSMTLISANDKTGTALASSTYAFVLDEGTADEEMVLADCTGTSCTNMTRGLSPLTATTSVYSLIKSHRRGASVKITDASFIPTHNMTLGKALLPNLLRYKNSVQACGNSDEICDKAYIDAVAVAGAPDASLTAKGILEVATAQEAASTTLTGHTTAKLALTTDIANLKGTTTVVITRPDGTIDPYRIATSSSDANYKWAGNHSWSASSTFSGSPVTFTGAQTSVQGSTTTLNAATTTINGVPYRWPTAANATGTVLMIANSPDRPDTGGVQLAFEPLSWSELGETVLSGANATITVSGLPPRKEYKITIFATGKSGAAPVQLLFNCCARGEYTSYATSTNNSGAQQPTDYAFSLSVGSTANHYFIVNVVNPASLPKYVNWNGTVDAGGGGQIQFWTGSGVWASSTPRISEVNVTSPLANTFGAGSRVTVYGSGN